MDDCLFKPLDLDSLTQALISARPVPEPDDGSSLLDLQHLTHLVGNDEAALKALLGLVAPFTPHLAEEGWTRLGEAGMILDAPWPVWDPALAADDEVTLPIQVNGKRRGEIRVARGLEPGEVEAIVMADPDVQARLEGLTVRKIVVVKDRIVNVVAA